MNIYNRNLDALREKARKDWENEEIEAVGDFETYFSGYLACLKRFGGSFKRTHKESWEGDVDRQSGAFTDWEIQNATAWR
jgi:hypothetical protein